MYFAPPIHACQDLLHTKGVRGFCNDNPGIHRKIDKIYLFGKLNIP
jgi:hypothetical protein